MKTTGTGATHKLDAEATSGAGSSGDVGIAGSLALNLVDVETLALIHAVSGRGPPTVTLTGPTADVSMSATSSVESTAKATASEDGIGGTVGIGASVAINSVDDITQAGLEDSGSSAWNPEVTGAHDLTLSATSTDSMTTTVEGGAAGATVVLVPVVAISLPTVHTAALMPAGDLLSVSGKVDAQASQTASSSTSAKGAAKAGASSTLAVGAALALVIADDQVSANVGRDVTADDAISFRAFGSSTNSSSSLASAAGAAGKDSSHGDGTDSTGKNVNQKADTQLKLGNDTKSSTNKSGEGSGKTATPKAQATDQNGDKTTITVAASVTIAIVSTSSTALIDRKSVV